MYPVRGLGLRRLISDFSDLLTSDGAGVGNVVPGRLEQEFKKKKKVEAVKTKLCPGWERASP